MLPRWPWQEVVFLWWAALLGWKWASFGERDRGAGGERGRSRRGERLIVAGARAISSCGGAIAKKKDWLVVTTETTIRATHSILNIVPRGFFMESQLYVTTVNDLFTVIYHK